MTDEPAELEGLRDDIDRIDGEIVDLIAERVHVAEEVAAVKSSAGRGLVDEAREEDVESHYAERFRQAGLDADHGRDLAEYVIELSLQRERETENGP